MSSTRTPRQETGRARRFMRQHWRKAVKVGLVLAIAIGAGAYGFETGQILARKEILRVTARMNDLNRNVQALERYNEVLALAADEAKINETAWRRRYEALAANAPGAADVLAVFKVVCESEPVVKTFRVQTPVSQAGRDRAGFADNRIVVAANGISAVSKNGDPLAWFDPDQPVAVSFRMLDGRVEDAGGILPVRHRMALDGIEYRFTVSRAARGLVDVAGLPCRRTLAPTVN